jgi:hypothetical protein
MVLMLVPALTAVLAEVMSQHCFGSECYVCHKQQQSGSQELPLLSGVVFDTFVCHFLKELEVCHHILAELVIFQCAVVVYVLGGVCFKSWSHLQLVCVFDIGRFIHKI